MAPALASISLDLDNLWSYLKTHGDPGWEKRPSYLERFIPRVLTELERAGLRITFFVVGVDAERHAGDGLLRSLTGAGHGVGNHSFQHEPWLHRYSRDELVREIAQAETAIEAATGRRPRAFRGPGFSWSPTLLEVLAERGYLVDASTLPTFLGPLARAWYFATARLRPEQREERGALFGSWRDGLRPVRPYRWDLAEGRSLLEIPVTTIPLVRTPFHLSYLIYLARWSESLMMAYLRGALRACRMARVEPSFLLHPLDLLGGDEVPELSFFPGMDLPVRKKTDLFQRVLGTLAERFTLVDLETHAEALLARTDVPLRAALAPGA